MARSTWKTSPGMTYVTAPFSHLYNSRYSSSKHGSLGVTAISIISPIELVRGFVYCYWRKYLWTQKEWPEWPSNEVDADMSMCFCDLSFTVWLPFAGQSTASWCWWAICDSKLYHVLSRKINVFGLLLWRCDRRHLPFHFGVVSSSSLLPHSFFYVNWSTIKKVVWFSSLPAALQPFNNKLHHFHCHAVASIAHIFML